MNSHHYLTSSNCADELWRRLHELLVPFGVTSVFYAIGHLPDLLKNTENLSKFLEIEKSLYSFHFKTSYPAEQLNVSGEPYRIEKDLSAVHCLVETTPFIWDSESCLLDSTISSQRQSAKYWYDIKLIGVTIPLRFNDFGKGGIGLCMGRLSSAEFDVMWSKYQEQVVDIVSLFDCIARDAFLDLVDIDVTCRERDILAWLMDGHSAKVIAVQLGTKQSTVQNQIITLRKKLHARNNVQLIARALTFKLI